MKTAMQELIEWIRYTNKECHSIMFNEGRFNEALKKEKEQIIDAMERTAIYVSVASIDKEIGKMTIEDLYNQTYNQNK